MGGIVHVVEQQLTAEQVHREILNVPAEHGGEHDGHDDHDQQRVQNAPDIAQEAAAVFQLNVFGYQQLQQIPVFP